MECSTSLVTSLKDLACSMIPLMLSGVSDTHKIQLSSRSWMVIFELLFALIVITGREGGGAGISFAYKHHQGWGEIHISILSRIGIRVSASRGFYHNAVFIEGINHILTRVIEQKLSKVPAHSVPKSFAILPKLNHRNERVEWHQKKFRFSEPFINNGAGCWFSCHSQRLGCIIALNHKTQH